MAFYLDVVRGTLATPVANIVIHTLPETGHINPTVALAKSLMERGHRVAYYIELDAHERLNALGLETLAYRPEDRPKGAIEAAKRLPLKELHAWNMDDLASRERAYESGADRERLAALKPDFVLGDPLCPTIRLVAEELQVAFARITTFLPSGYHPGRIPWSSHALPNSLSVRDVELEWRANFAGFREFLAHNPPLRSSHAIARTIAHSGLLPNRVDWITLPFLVDADHEFIMCSESFDRPRITPPHWHFLGPCLDPSPDEGWSFPGRRPGAPLVFCAFGTMTNFYVSKVRSMILALLALAKRRTDIDFLIAASGPVLGDEPPPANVHVEGWVPQRAVLKDVDLFITHGGLGSVKEAMWEGVPMLVVPCQFDQPGNAAQVVHHGLGLRLVGEESADATLIGSHVDTLLADPRYRENAAKMAQEVREDSAVSTGAQVIEGILAGQIATTSNSEFAARTQTLLRRLSGF